MTAAERRAANRARVAARFGEEAPPPGMDGPELLYLRKLTAGRRRVQSRTEYERGWQSSSFTVGAGQ